MNQPAISILPHEILSSIFLFNASLDSFQINGPNHLRILQDTTRYTSQVCREWRFLVLENPIIWSRVVDFTRGSPQWTEECLRRAADCPLSLVHRYRPLRSSEFLVRELEHVSRIGQYDGVFTTEIWPALLDKIQQPAPYLEEFRLEGSDNGQCALPATIFGRNAPRLRQLRLECCSFDDDLPYLSQLTLLSISQTSNFPPKKWLDILPSMPSLTVLELEGVNVGSKFYAAVQLPNLVNIKLTASLGECSAFLSCLVLPPTCGMRVYALDARPGADFNVTAGIVKQKLEFYLNKTIESDRRLYLHFGEDFFFIKTERVRAALQPLKPPYIFFDISWTTLEGGLPSILPSVSSVFAGPLSQINSVKFLIDFAPPSRTHSAIVNVLRQANKVISLAPLDRWTANIFLQLVARHSTCTQTKEDVIFPSLRIIHLDEQGPDFFASADPVVQSLVDFIWQRISIAAPIEEISYTSSIRISSGEVAHLEETGILVTRREWF